MKSTNANKYYLINKILITVSFIVRLIYIIITDVGVRQHDLGYATSIHDNLVNPGHLGYVDYIAKFHHLPDFDPFTLFSYFHPPFHHIIAALFVDAADAIGISEPGIYEAIQIPTLIYSCISVILVYKILHMLCSDEKRIILPLALFAFHPGLIYITGSVNNDMLALLFIILCIYTTMLWINNNYKLSKLILMSFSIGFGLIAKMNVAIMIIPMGLCMLIHLIDEYKASHIIRIIKEYSIFAFIAIPIGISWTVRNIIRFGTKPGIPSSSPNQYTGDISIINRFLIPVKSNLGFPFYSENATYNSNIWEICFKTSLFSEIWPVDISDFGLILCQILFVSAILLGVCCAIYSIIKPIRIIKSGDRMMGIFLLSGFITVIVSFIVFNLKYPYVCSSDFRYVSISILFSSIALLPVNNKADINI